MKVRVEEVTDVRVVGDAWQALEPHCDASFFQSWGWIGVWLRSLSPGTRTRLFVVETPGQVVGLALVVSRNLRRHGLLGSRALFLHEAGEPDRDFIVEHNGMLLRTGFERGALDAFIAALVREYPQWDELFVSGIRADSALFIDRIGELHGLRLRVLRESSSRYVDLAALRRSGADFLATLSSNTRYQIRRAIRRYEENGPLQLAVAGTREQAQGFFGDLKVLHQAYWTARGEPGSFARESWERFHRSLIDERFDQGEIQLLRITAGNKVIGHLYNFVRNGWVYALQSGFAYEDDSALHPGYVSHYLAIRHNLERGARVYDFLAGEARYKSSLARGDHPLVWVVLQRQRLKFRVEDGLRALRRRARGMGADTRLALVVRGADPVPPQPGESARRATCADGAPTPSADSR